jgi:hypothetical protein
MITNIKFIVCVLILYAFHLLHAIIIKINIYCYVKMLWNEEKFHNYRFSSIMHWTSSSSASGAGEFQED